MNKTVQSILGDLYSLDPKLKKLEKDLVPLLEKLVEAKPKLTLDENFVANLKSQLMVRADELMEAEKPVATGWFSRVLAPLMGGTVALAALVIGLMVWNGTPNLKRESPFVQTTPKIHENSLSEPFAAEPESVQTPAPAPIPKADTFAKRVQAPERSLEKTEPKAPEATPEAPASAPMMLQALPAGSGVTETATPPATPKAVPRQMDTASLGMSNVGVGSASIVLNDLKRAQSGERKITADSAQTGFRSPQELININFDNLPNDFGEIENALPSGYRAFVDWGSGAPEYYIYFENTYQWYGPF